jgi:hypothetical protein
MTVLSQLSNDELADGICTWAGRVAAGEAELMRWIAEFDRREAWGGPGLLSCAHWLSWRIGLSPGAAREKARVARALDELPLVQRAFSEGRVSYSQARAITRVATPDDQQRWVDLARCTTAGQLEKLVRGVRRVRKLAEDEADPELASWRMRARKRYDEDGNAVYTIVLPAEQAPVLDAALEAMRSELDAQREAAAQQAAEQAAEQAQAAQQPAPDDDEASGVSAETRCPQGDDARHGTTAPTTDPLPVTLLPAPPPSAGDLDQGPTASRRSTVAEAFLEMACRILDRQAAEHPARARRSRATLIAQVDPISGWARLRDGELLPPTSLAAVMRTLPGREKQGRLRPLTAADLRRHDLGRRQRLVSLALRELLGTLDGERCRFPGCTRHSRLDAHHVVFWSDGGPTDLANLVKHEAAPGSRGERLGAHDSPELQLWPVLLMQLLAVPLRGRPRIARPRASASDLVEEPRRCENRRVHVHQLGEMRVPGDQRHDVGRAHGQGHEEVVLGVGGRSARC